MENTTRELEYFKKTNENSKTEKYKNWNSELNRAVNYRSDVAKEKHNELEDKSAATSQKEGWKGK